jgi:hypothetical protein
VLILNDQIKYFHSAHPHSKIIIIIIITVRKVKYKFLEIKNVDRKENQVLLETSFFFFFFALSFNFSSQIIFRDNFTKGYQIIRYFEIIVLN